MILALLLTLGSNPSALPPPCIITEHSARAALAFDEHPAKIWNGMPAKPTLDTPDKRLFRTALTKGAAKGPNFAGHMTIVQWGCGSACVAWAAVDSRTGKVTKLQEANYFSTLYVGGELGGVNFRRESALLVLAGAPREDEAREGVYSYVWKGDGFRRVGFVPRAKACEPFEALRRVSSPLHRQAGRHGGLP